MKMFIIGIVKIIAALFVLILVVAFLYTMFSPQMGARNGGYSFSLNFIDGKFKNLVDTSMTSGDGSMVVSMYEFFFKKHEDVFPKETIQTEEVDLKLLSNLKEGEVAVAWLGNSTVLIKTKDITILTDPVLNGKRVPPLHLGPKPFPYSTTYDIDNLPKVDVVLISHDHYDHLDMETIKKLKDKKFFVPLGVKEHLVHWGVDESNITELDWYAEKEYSEGATIALTPTRHFSGRGLLDRNSTLWGAWVLQLGGKKLYFGGDSGYFEEFKKVGEKYGPFDLAFLDTGQYDVSWQLVHMLPEEGVQAALDLQAKAMLPIHNSKYILSKHAWYEPLERVTAAAQKNNVNVTTPRIGKTFLLDDDLPTTKWWEQ